MKVRISRSGSNPDYPWVVSSWVRMSIIGDWLHMPTPYRTFEEARAGAIGAAALMAIGAVEEAQDHLKHARDRVEALVSWQEEPTC